MEASDMLDVIHYYFEDDHRYASFDEASFKDQFRSSIFKNLYDSEYSFGQSNDDTPDYRDNELELDAPLENEKEVIEPFNPRAKSVKRFIEPTNFDEDSSKPFGSVLDGPIG
jgi:hypothetical protein